MKILVTGSAGFIGYHLVKALISRGDKVVGLDNINNYYDVNLKLDRLADSGIQVDSIGENLKSRSIRYNDYCFLKVDLSNKTALNDVFEEEKFDAVCHLAAQAGVRYSLINPTAYIDSNITGFLNILECCRNFKIKHLVYASSSSVYGLNQNLPFSIHDNVDHPVSLYAATKKSNELMAHAYSHLFNIPTTGLRFFTVYGPWGRPDMALYSFTKSILDGKPIEIFNEGKMKRDFTYIEDIISGIVKIISVPAKVNPDWNALSPDPASSKNPFRIYNIGRGSSVALMDFVQEIEYNLNLVALKTFMPMQDGDVVETWADVTEISTEFDFNPKVSIKEGIKNFIDWYKDYYFKKTSF